MTERQADRAWLVAVGLLTSVWCVTAAARLGWTIDETFYVSAGLAEWAGGTAHEGRLTDWGTMPLPVHVQALPMHLWVRAVGPAPDSRLPAARATNLLFWWLLLASAQRLGRRAGGRWAGRLGLLLVGFDPTALGHAALATTDVPVTAAVLTLADRFWAGQTAGGWWRRVVRPGLWFGAAVLCKGSGATYGLVVLAVGEAARLAAGRRWAVPREWVASAAVAAAVAGIGGTVAVLYCGFDAPAASGAARLAAAGHPADPWTVRFAAVASWPVVPRAVTAGLFQLRHNAQGWGCVVFGAWHPRPVWYYFPATLLVKLPVGVLALGLGLLLTRPRALATRPLVMAAVALVLVLPSRLPIGVRLVMPVMALGLIGLAAAAVRSGWCPTR